MRQYAAALTAVSTRQTDMKGRRAGRVSLQSFRDPTGVDMHAVGQLDASPGLGSDRQRPRVA
jgi:hypothetical protein